MGAKIRGLALAMGIAIAACSSPDEENTGDAESFHTERSWVHENAPYYWGPSTYGQFTSASEAAYWSKLPDALGDDHPLTVRLQAWLDRIHDVVRADVERETGKPFSAPRPLAKVLHTKSMFNAWVSGIPACIGGTFGKPEAPSGNLAYVDRARVGYAGGAACVRPEGWNRDEVVSFWNAAKPSCRMTADGAAINVAGSGCTVEAPATDDIAIMTASPFIHFTTDLLAEVDEDTLAVIAAHELGHYYRGHVTAKAYAKYNFWYEREEGRKRAPVPAANAAELQNAYLEVIQRGQPLGGPTFASQYSGRMRAFLLGGLAPLLQERTEPDFVCKQARDALGSWVTIIRAGGLPPADAQASFVKFENELKTCAPRLSLTGEPSATSISAGSVLFAASEARPGPKTKITLRFGDSLGAFIDRLNEQAKELDGKAARLVARLKSNRIGLYTTEQEADDFAMELSTKIGLSKDRVLQGWLDFMRAIDRIQARSYTPEQLAEWRKTSSEIDAEACSALMRDGFTREENGQRAPVTMSLGQLEEPHHPSCYRLWNLWRESRVHDYVAAPPPADLAPAWSDLKGQAAALVATAPEPPPPPASQSSSTPAPSADGAKAP